MQLRKRKIYSYFLQKGAEGDLGENHDGLYYLHRLVVKGEAFIRAQLNLINIRHSRLGHTSLKNMNLLVKEGYLT